MLAYWVFQVRALKVKIEEERGKDAYPATGQKLIYAGEKTQSLTIFLQLNVLCVMIIMIV